MEWEEERNCERERKGSVSEGEEGKEGVGRGGKGMGRYCIRMKGRGEGRKGKKRKEGE